MSAKDKTGSKTGRKPGTFAPGEDVRRGHGRAGRSGRKPVAFLAECAEITDEVLLPKVRAYLTSHQPDDPGFRWAGDLVVGYAKGRPTQPVEVTHMTHEEALDALDG